VVLGVLATLPLLARFTTASTTSLFQWPLLERMAQHMPWGIAWLLYISVVGLVFGTIARVAASLRSRSFYSPA
jgi:hypothetical protein